MSGASILVVDDEKSLQSALRVGFEQEGWCVATAGCTGDALAQLDREEFDVLVSDIILPDLSGLEILQRARTLRAPPAEILITAYATRQPSRRSGAAPERTIVGSSQAMTAVRVKIARCAASTSNVLVTGESGTVRSSSRATHASSPRRDEPFVAINCGAIPESLFETQLFGHARGAFTGAVQANPGLFVTARRGTLVLDEIGELPPSLQVKLLRVIEDNEVWPVGGTAPVHVQTRLIASTSRDLRADVAAHRFREDLFYRLNTVHIAVPALRERRHDIALLVEHFIARFNGHLGRNIQTVTPEALELLMNCDWRGNVRELEHVIESAVTAGEGDMISVEDLPPELRAAPGEDSLREASRRFERQHILDVLNHVDFDKREAARCLGLSLASLYRKIGPSPA
jgi:DNA-binding NtrC family response regulator